MIQKDYSTISPSAKSTLLMKGYTDIPYAQQVAALMPGPEVFGLSFDENDFWFWIRVLHFESRYKSIDQLLQQTGATNVLELSSGYSFRGIDLCAKDENVYYIDTDLPDVVAVKQQMITELNAAGDAKGSYELLPLNATDDAAMDRVVGRFTGPIAIVNEGLLMYLNTDEKKQLCAGIHKALTKHGGCWITADVYVKRSDDIRASLPQTKGETAFFEQHHIEENKFDSYEAAEVFFREEGFELVKEAVIDLKDMSALPQLVKVLPPEVLNSKEPPPKIQATWMLKAI